MVRKIIWIPAFAIHGMLINAIGLEVPDWRAFVMLASGGMLYCIGLIVNDSRCWPPHW